MENRRENLICNMDCFHCRFADCINDDPEPKRDRESGSYYDLHREERLAYQAKYKEEHREEFLSYQKKYYQRNAIRKKQANRERYQRLKQDPEFMEKERQRKRQSRKGA